MGGDQNVTVAGDRNDETTGNAHEKVAAHKTVTVAGDLGTHVTGGLRTSVAGAGTAVLSGGFTACAGGVEGKPGSIAVFADGAVHAGAKQGVYLLSDAQIVLQVGKSRLVMTPDQITLESKVLVLLGNESTSLFGKDGIKGPALHLTDDAQIVAPKLALHAKHASLALEENADLRGKLVRLNCNDDTPPSSSKDGAAKDETKAFTVKLHDADFGAHGGKHYRLVAGGLTREGTIGADGSVSEQIPKDATSVVVTVWIDDFPTGRRQSWTLDVVDAMPPSTSLAGAIGRLKNLGYEPGVDDKTMDGPTRKALIAFQKDHELKQTGEIDAATVAALEARHGH